MGPSMCSDWVHYHPCSVLSLLQSLSSILLPELLALWTCCIASCLGIPSVLDNMFPRSHEFPFFGLFCSFGKTDLPHKECTAGKFCDFACVELKKQTNKTDLLGSYLLKA
jgi:hypothetical protein